MDIAETLSNVELEQLYREMYDWLLGYANASLSNPSRAEEAVQETFRIACDKQTTLLESDNPKGWLVNTLKGVLRNFSRKRFALCRNHAELSVAVQ